MARPSARGSWRSYSRGKGADVEALTERDRCRGCCTRRTVLGLRIFVSSARGRPASLRFFHSMVECRAREYVHVWEASPRIYEARGRPRGRTGRSSDLARWLTSTRMVSGATWCSAARSRAATAGRHTRNRTSHSKTAPSRGRRTGGAPTRGRVLMRGAHRRPPAPRAARGCAAQNRSVRQASSRIQTVFSLHRRAHRRIPVSTPRSTGRRDRRSTAASSGPTLASRGTHTARLRSLRTSGHHVRTASRNQARTARMSCSS